MQKTVFIDTNMVNKDGSYFVSDMIIRQNGYAAGDLVTAYQDYDAWQARIVKTDGIWGVELLSEAERISDDRYEGHREGYAFGAYIEKLAAIRILQKLNLPDHVIEAVRQELDLIG